MKRYYKFCTWLIFIALFFFIHTIHSEDITPEDCMECHSDDELAKTDSTGKEISLFIDLEKFKNSIHGDFGCIDCHADISELPHDENLEKPNCAMCHEDVSEIYMESFHGKALAKGNQDAPNCSSCHSTHYVYGREDSLSLTNPNNLPQTCAVCHSDPTLVKKYHIPIQDPTAAYEKSIHYKAIHEKGSLTSATCSDCHGAHTLQPVTDPNSMIYRMNIPTTCSKCHGEIYQEYIGSVHGQGLLAGATDAPVCTDCHSEHSIKEHTDPSSTVFSTVVSQTTCAHCHEAEQIVSKYGLSKNSVTSFNDSFHGLANRSGSTVAANCASCHGVHNILPSSDPKSSVSKENLPNTCAKCHPGVNEQVTIGKVHLAPDSDKNSIAYYVRLFYITLIISVIGGMVLHNAIDYIKKANLKYRGKVSQTEPGGAKADYVRLTINERIQHFLLFISFVTLVVTGFALKFPEAWWVTPFSHWDGAFALRGIAHRVAAVIMIGLSVYHVFYLIFTERGRNQFKAFFPVVKDAIDAIQLVKFNLNLSGVKPKFARYNYIEKAEYWALIWGTVVMTFTGLVLWFENIAMRIFPIWFIDICTMVHYFEAILATLAILVWHFYFQFFDPDAYPINFTCVTGKMSLDELKHHHPLEYEEELKKK